MRWFHRRAWYLASIAIALAATAVEARAGSLIADGAIRTARASHARHEGASQGVLAAINEHGKSQMDRGSWLGALGLALAVVSAACFVASRVRLEPGHRIVPICVWILYFYCLLLTV
jgi:hypothetical protein